MNASDDAALIADKKIAPMMAVLIGNPESGDANAGVAAESEVRRFPNSELVAWVRKN
ncbi:MAG: hypothetical protein JWP63_2965 [Candidatus Solibacter sp.]|nr:hypothetical protein [Candidatus Solibacter sp.]